MAQAIDNTSLLGLSNGSPSLAGFTPVQTYVYDAVAATVEVTDASVIPAGDTLVKVLVHIWDRFGKPVEGQITATGVPGKYTADVSGLNRAKPLDMLVTVITTKGLVADGGAYGLQPAGNLSYYDKQEEGSII